MQCTDPRSTLPRRLCGTPTTSGILLGSDPGHVRTARRWAARATRSRPGLAEPVSVVVSELVTNALRHSASGDPGGTVRVEVQRTRRYLELRVTDNGPRPRKPVTYPEIPQPRPATGGNGLRLVEALSVYWEWNASVGGAVTVRALFETP